MTPQPDTVRLTDLLQSLEAPAADRAQRLQRVNEHLFARSKEIRSPNFPALHTADLPLLFEAYDREFFSGQMRTALGERPLSFKLSRRMSRAAGHTKCVRFRDGRVTFEIAVAGPMLFEGFGPNDRPIAACGIECPSRLDALQRIFEHELVHLGEMLCWQRTKCSAPRFQAIAARLFGHQSHTHDLITRRERAAQKGIGPGAQVTFVFEGQPLHGRVHRVTTRATVLVEDPQGRRFRYYVPIHLLQLKP